MYNRLDKAWMDKAWAENKVYALREIQEIKECMDYVSLKVGKEKEKAMYYIWEEHPCVHDAFVLLLDPMVTFGIQIKSLTKRIAKEPSTMFLSMVDMCRWLSLQKGLSDQDIRNVQYFMEKVMLEDEELERFARQYITKTLTIGITAKTLNKAVGAPVVPVFECMLANKYFEHPDAVKNKTFAITEKLDGIRCLAVVKEGEKPKLYSRQGQPIDGLTEIENELTALQKNHGLEFVLDGELLIADRDRYPSKEQYKRTTKIVRKDGEKSGIEFNAFDIVSPEVFLRHNCDTPYWMRRQKLMGLLEGTKHVNLLPTLYVGNDQEQILKCLEAQRNLGHEGVMVNLLEAPYEFKRTNNILKVKVMQDCDLEIIGFQEGTGKFEGTLGSLICDYKGHPVGVGSGLSDKFRLSVWSDPEKYLGRVATIQYFEETVDKNNIPSIRFPVFKELREEGKEISYN